ncbi:MAG: hypothetical protein GX484_09220 [Chloroflexi bacterium]|nr:hypothetical protein [Chloroflexota bacterium]
MILFLLQNAAYRRRLERVAEVQAELIAGPELRCVLLEGEHGPVRRDLSHAQLGNRLGLLHAHADRLPPQVQHLPDLRFGLPVDEVHEVLEGPGHLRVEGRFLCGLQQLIK